MNILGIDPGLSGAIAQWDGEDLSMLEIPTIEAQGRGREVNWPLLVEQWDNMFFSADHVFLERVMSRPGEGVSSAFKFGSVFGGLHGIIAAKLLPMTLVTPNTWKKHYSIMASKEAAVRRATYMFPKHASAFCGSRGGLKDGLAEAALIAFYGFQKMGAK